MKFIKLEHYSIQSLLVIAHQNKDNPDFYELIKLIIKDKLVKLSAHELCSISQNAKNSLLREMALEALSFKDIENEIIDLFMIKKAISQMNYAQIWRVASPNRETIIGLFAHECLMKKLEEFDYLMEKEEQFTK